ncbi:MAG: radical SAM protein [Candidatus Omnitrophica bacterium]|nr:radical SAM protein [Candidatus Omnitrophota bacterium]
MPLIITKPNITEKLSILSRDSKYDLACSCAPRDDEHRKRSFDDKWVYPVVLPNGGKTFLFKTLLSNACVNNCKYCPLRSGSEPERTSIEPEELSRTFLSYYSARKVSGLFLSSAVRDDPDNTMDRINRSAISLRNKGFKGYIHLKIIPGSSDAAIRKALSLSTAVSLNIETAGVDNFRTLTTTKDYMNDIVRPIKLISRLTSKGGEFPGVKQTTQFVVGAAEEKDKDIIGYSWRLYKGLGLSRVYFSAYQRGAGTRDIPGENSPVSNADLLAREHRLYQADWLMRKYGFQADEIPVTNEGNLSLVHDPKEAWANAHPEFFPVNVNKDDKYRLLRVPGLGHVVADRILETRKTGSRIRSLDDLMRRGKLLAKAERYISF